MADLTCTRQKYLCILHCSFRHFCFLDHILEWNFVSNECRCAALWIDGRVADLTIGRAWNGTLRLSVLIQHNLIAAFAWTQCPAIYSQSILFYDRKRHPTKATRLLLVCRTKRYLSQNENIWSRFCVLSPIMRRTRLAPAIARVHWIPGTRVSFNDQNSLRVLALPDYCHGWL